MLPDSAHIAELLRQIEEKDMSTVAHTWRVALYTRAMAELAGSPTENIERFTLGAALHDLGKLDVPTAILQKPGRLTEEEFDAVKLHPVAGFDRLVAMGVDDQAVLDLVRHHHERIDGLGYPDGLRGEEIPRIARFFAVIDTFDALTSVRPYRREVGPRAAERALEELHAGVGSRYCRDAVEMFAQLYRSHRVDWVLGHFQDGAGVRAFDGSLKSAE